MLSGHRVGQHNWVKCLFMSMILLVIHFHLLFDNISMMLSGLYVLICCWATHSLLNKHVFRFPLTRLTQNSLVLNFIFILFVNSIVFLYVKPTIVVWFAKRSLLDKYLIFTSELCCIFALQLEILLSSNIKYYRKVHRWPQSSTLCPTELWCLYLIATGYLVFKYTW